VTDTFNASFPIDSCQDQGAVKHDMYGQTIALSLFRLSRASRMWENCSNQLRAWDYAYGHG
jgi:hypothetical protein